MISVILLNVVAPKNDSWKNADDPNFKICQSKIEKLLSKLKIRGMYYKCFTTIAKFSSLLNLYICHR
jgi:hypothetical protein